MSVTTERVLSSRAVIGEIMLALDRANTAGWVDAVSMQIDSTQDEEKYGWLGMTPQLREWTGGRQAKGLREFEYTIKNKHYEATLDVPVRHMRRDQFGQTQRRIADLAGRAADHWASLLSTLIINGESTAGYDGQFFFDTDHSEGDSGTQSNDISVDISAAPTSVHGATTAPSVEEFQYVVTSAIQQMLGFKDDQGEPMNDTATQFLVMVPPSLWMTGSRALSVVDRGSGFASQLDVSVNDFQVRLAANARLSAWTTKVAVFRTDGSVKPLIRQAETGVNVSAKAEGSEYEFDNDAHQYGVDTWRNVGYGFWQAACLATMT